MGEENIPTSYSNTHRWVLGDPLNYRSPQGRSAESVSGAAHHGSGRPDAQGLLRSQGPQEVLAKRLVGENQRAPVDLKKNHVVRVS